MDGLIGANIEPDFNWSTVTLPLFKVNLRGFLGSALLCYIYCFCGNVKLITLGKISAAFIAYVTWF